MRLCFQRKASQKYVPTLWRRANHAQTANDRFNILFMGRDEFSCIVLEQLYQAQDLWSQLHVATQPDRHVGRRGSVLAVSSLKVKSNELKLPVHFIPAKRSEFKSWKPPSYFSESPRPRPQDLILTASFGRILPPSLLDLFRPTRRLNVHPSLVPAYRGPSPIQYAIMNGDSQTGVSIIEMLPASKGIDAGDIWASKDVPSPENPTYATLRDVLAVEGGKLLVALLKNILRDKASSSPQPDRGLTRAPLITMKDAVVDFRSMDASTIVRRHNAFSHQKPLVSFLPQANTSSNATLEEVFPVQLHSPIVFTDSDGKISHLAPGEAFYHPRHKLVLIGCCEGSLLGVPQLKSENKPLRSGLDWWNGVKGLGLAVDGKVRFTTPKNMDNI